MGIYCCLGPGVYLQSGFTSEGLTLVGFNPIERLLLNHANTPGFLAPGGEFNPGPETSLDRSELLCNKVLLKYKGDRESF